MQNCRWLTFDYFVEEYAEEFPFTYDEMLQQEFAQNWAKSPIFLKFMDGLKLSKSLLMTFLVSINQAI
jgi:hypothetical protein